MRSRLRAGPLAAATALALSVARPADAHLVTTGLGPVYDGISHVFLSPDDLVPVIALALLAGLNGPAAGRAALFAITGAWLVGGVSGFLAAFPLPAAATAAVSFLLLGGLTAADRPLSPRMVAALAVALGLLHGGLNGAGIAEARREVIGLAGIAGAIFVVASLASALVVSLRVPSARLAVRVVGSWVAAVGLLMLGWALRGAP